MPHPGRLTIITLATSAAAVVLAGSAAMARAGRDGARRTLVIWTDVRGGGPLQVAVDGRPRGTLTSFFRAGAPDCRDTTGALILSLPAGEHVVLAADDAGRHWAAQVSLKKGRCALLRLGGS